MRLRKVRLLLIHRKTLGLPAVKAAFQVKDFGEPAFSESQRQTGTGAYVRLRSGAVKHDGLILGILHSPLGKISRIFPDRSLDLLVA